MQSRVLARTISRIIDRFELTKVYGWIKPLGNDLKDGEMPMGTVKELEQWAIRLIRGVGYLSDDELAVMSHFGLNWLLDDQLTIQISHNLRTNQRYPIIRQTPTGKQLGEMVRCIELMRSYIRATVSLVTHGYEREAEKADRTVVFHIRDEDGRGTDLHRFSKVINAIDHLATEFSKTIDPSFTPRVLMIESGSDTSLSVEIAGKAAEFADAIRDIFKLLLFPKETRAGISADSLLRNAEAEAKIERLYRNGEISHANIDVYRLGIRRNLVQMFVNGGYPDGHEVQPSDDDRLLTRVDQKLLTSGMPDEELNQSASESGQ